MRPSPRADDPTGYDPVLTTIISRGQTAAALRTSGGEEDVIEVARLVGRTRECVEVASRQVVLTLSAAHGVSGNRISQITGISQSTVARWIAADRRDPEGVHAAHAER